MIAGNKERLERRLERAQAATLSRSRCQSVLQDFLGAYTPVPPDEKPLLNGIYHATFNLDDRFDHLVSNIHYTPRVFSEFNRVFVSLVQFAAVTSFVLCKDNSSVAGYPPCPDTARAFAMDLADTIMDFAKHANFLG
jgi:hypothetical protein